MGHFSIGIAQLGDGPTSGQLAPRIAARHGGGLPAAGSLQFDDGRSGGASDCADPTRSEWPETRPSIPASWARRWMIARMDWVLRRPRGLPALSRRWNSGPSAIPAASIQARTRTTVGPPMSLFYSHLWDFVDSSPAGAPGRRIPADRQRDRRAAGLPLVRCTVARPGEGGSVAWCWLLRERLPA